MSMFTLPTLGRRLRGSVDMSLCRLELVLNRLNNGKWFTPEWDTQDKMMQWGYFQGLIEFFRWLVVETIFVLLKEKKLFILWQRNFAPWHMPLSMMIISWEQKLILNLHCVFMSIDTQKKKKKRKETKPISSHIDRTSLVNKGFNDIR